MKKFLLCLPLLLVFTLIGGDQPGPYIQGDISIQPILENEDLDIKYQYIRSIKVYYRDPLDKPIILQNKQALYNYCSDSSVVIFKSAADSIKIPSVKRMSCEIMAIINLSKRDSEWLKSHIVNEVAVVNTITDNRFSVYMDDKEYFRRLMLKYNAKY
jgi:hypothetical protein